MTKASSGDCRPRPEVYRCLCEGQPYYITTLTFAQEGTCEEVERESENIEKKSGGRPGYSNSG